MTNLATGLVLGSPATRRARFTPLSLPDCAAWVGWGPRHRTASGASPILDATGEPYVYDSTPVVGSIGGTMGSAGSARFLVAGIESGGQWKQCALADDTNTHQDHSGAASDWTKFHQSATLFLALRTTANGFLCDTADQGDPNSVGVCTFASAASEYINFSIYNGTGTPFFTTTNVVGSLPINRVCIVELVFDGTGWEYWIDGVSIASGGVTGSAAPGAPANTLRLGASHAGSPNRWGGNFLEMALYWGVKSAAERGDVRDYLAAEWQNNSYRLLAAPTFWPALLTGGITVESGALSRIEDAAGNARASKQTNASLRPARVVSSELGGAVAASADGVDDRFDVVGQPFGAETHHDLIVACDPQNGLGTLEYLFDAWAGRLVFNLLTNVAGQLGWYDGAWKSVAEAAVGAQQLHWSLDATGTTGKVYRDGVLIGTAAYTPVAMGGTTRCFGQSGGGGGDCEVVSSDLFFKSGAAVMADDDPEMLWRVLAEQRREAGLPYTPLEHPGHVSLLQPSQYREMWIEGAQFEHPKKLSEWTQYGISSVTDNSTDLADHEGKFRYSKVVEDTSTATHQIREVPYGCVDAFGWIEVYHHEGTTGSQRGVTISADNKLHYARFFGGEVVYAWGSCKGSDNAEVVDLGDGHYLYRARILPRSVDKSIILFLNDGTNETYTGDGASHGYLRDAWIDQAEGQLLDPFDLTSGNWTRTNLQLPTGGQSDPDGGANAFTLTDTSDGAPTWHTLDQTPTALQAGPARCVRYVKAGTKTWWRWAHGAQYLYMNLSDGSLGARNVTPTVTDVGSGWYRVEIPYTAAAATASKMGPANGDAAGQYQGDGTGTILVYAPVVEQRRVLAEFDQSRALASVVTNGEFATDTVWTKGTNWTISGGAAHAAGATAAQYLEQACLTSGVRYEIEFTVTSYTSGSVTPYAGTQAGTAVSAAGRYRQVITASGTALKFGGSAAGFTGDIDIVSAKPANDTFQPDAGAQPIYWPATEDEPAHLQFDGAHHWIGLLPATADMTLLGWFWLDQITSSTQCLVGARSAGLDFAEIIVTAVGELRGYCGGSAQYVQHSVTTFPVAGWHHVAFTCDGSGNLRIMLDGVSVTNTSGGTPPTEDMYLGARNAAGAADCFAGIRRGGFDQLNRALPESEILDIFEHEKAAYGL